MSPIVYSRCVVALVVLTVTAGAAIAVPTPDPITGKYYETDGQLTWDAARVDAAGRLFGGTVGHLATISDRNENSLVLNLGSPVEKWIGLTDLTVTSTLDSFDLSSLGTSEQGDTSGLPLPAPGVEPVVGERGAGFRWVTGEPYTFLNWRAGAPGNGFGGTGGVHTISTGVWQDGFAGPTVGEAGFGGTEESYVVEYETVLDQHRFQITERKAAASFNGGAGLVTLAQAESLLALPLTHADVEREEQGQAYVISFQDHDLGGGLVDYARRPYLLNEFGVDEDNFAYLATAQVLIPAAGDWTFAVMSGDEFRLTVGDNEFIGVGTLQTGPPILSRASEGALTAAPGGSGETFYFPAPGVYDLELLTLESGFAAFIQLFAAPNHQTSFDPAAFDLVGDELNGGLMLVPEPSSGALLMLAAGWLAGVTRRRQRV